MIILWAIYNILFPVVFLFMLPKFISRMLKRGGYGEHFEQRLGFFDQEIKGKFVSSPRIWVHAVSVGEMYVGLRFIKAWRLINPDACFALSTNTSTSMAIARKEMDARDVVFYFPVDLPFVIRKVLSIVCPQRIVLVEAEYWPNLIRISNELNIPVSLINGRVSASSYKGYMKIRALTADVLRRIRPFVMQDEVDASRIKDMGASLEDVHVLGSVKFDVAERSEKGERVALEVVGHLGLPPRTMILLGGSTWPGEEAALCRLYKKLRKRFPELFLILVPRHVERVDELLDVLSQEGLSCVRRSDLKERCSKIPDLMVVDSTGELRNFYSLADLIFVGKSLSEHGGQNPIEPAMYGKAVIVGPNMENFPSVMPLFLARNAIVQVENEEALGLAIEYLLLNAQDRCLFGERAACVVEERRGVMDKSVQRVIHSA